jgi:hypothetical protein
MKRVWWIVGWMALLLIVVPAVAIAAVWFALPLDATTITVGGESFSLADLSAGQVAGLWVLAVLAVAAALAFGVAATVLGLAVGALAVGVGVAAAIGAVAIVASPLLLVGWLVWRTVRRRQRTLPTTAAA